MAFDPVTIRGIKPYLYSGARVTGIYLLATVLALLAGVVSGSSQPVLVMVTAGLIVALALSTSRSALFWFVLVGGLVVAGAAQLYLPGAKYLRYVVPLASLTILLHGALDSTKNPLSGKRSNPNSLLFWALSFVGLSFASMTINWSGLGIAIMGMKGYFQMWGFLFALILVRFKPRLIDSVPKAILLIALLQLPFVLHQYLFLVPIRVGLGGGIVPVDVVAGTFGATLLGGGANAVLAAFMVVVVACLLGVWKRGAISRSRAILYSMLLLGPMFLNEAKITVVYLPVVFLILFYGDIVRHPIRFIFSGLALAGLLAALMTALTLANTSSKIETWSDLVEFTIQRQTASVSEREGYSELSRWTALTFWFNQHIHDNPIHALIGHGPGASRVQDSDSGLDLAGRTLAETRYGGLPIGYTSVSALLWDTGVLGLLLVLALFASAFNKATQLMHHYEMSDPMQAGIFDGLRAGILVLVISLAHKDFFAFHLPYQTLVVLIFGYLSIKLRNLNPDLQRGRSARVA